jgi:hypothetical protein
LVEQADFDGLTGGLEVMCKAFGGEFRAEGFGAQSFERREIERESAEVAGILKDERAGVQREGGSSVFGEGEVRGLDEEASSHAEVDEEPWRGCGCGCLGSNGTEDEILAEAVERVDLMLVELVIKVLGGMGAAAFITQDVGVVNGLGFDKRTQVLGKDLDFGQFRHGGKVHRVGRRSNTGISRASHLESSFAAG